MPWIASGRLTDVSLTIMGFGSHIGYRAQTLLCAGLLALSAATALAQVAGAPDKKEDPGFFTSVGKWFDEQLSGAKSAFDNFGREAGAAAKTTADTAKDAADTFVKKLPATTVVSGHEVCRIAPNGAPDCETAATSICKAKGFKSGKSMDMTTAENCPARVYIAGRSTASECRTETFVSSALCQ
ncbi:MAG TPA: hypothetical protein VN655_01960 [Pseudolabrys sp.]|nr:hypothetical protein [Pseudolabrys sp.]